MANVDRTNQNAIVAVGGQTLTAVPQRAEDALDGTGTLEFASTLRTTDGNAATIATLTPADGKSVTVRAQIVGRKSDGSQVAGYDRIATFRRAVNTTTQVGATTATATHEDDAAWDATIDSSGADVRVRVTGKAATTIDWTARITAAVAP